MSIEKPVELSSRSFEPGTLLCSGEPKLSAVAEKEKRSGLRSFDETLFVEQLIGRETSEASQIQIEAETQCATLKKPAPNRMDKQGNKLDRPR